MNTVAGRARVAVAGLVVLAGAAGLRAAGQPAWWAARGVVDPAAVSTNDFSAANQGQVKWIASNACAELEATLPGGVGTAAWGRVAAFTTNHNYAAVNLGQLKHVAEPFYARLIAVGWTNAYPWAGAASTNDYALANVGQVKNLFGFDPGFDSDADGLPDWWEQACFGRLDWGASIDLDGDGLSNLQEYQALGSPKMLDTDGDGVPDDLDANPSVSADSDGDGLPDDWELFWFGGLSQTGSGDTDGDGVSNLDEYRMGLDPTRVNDPDAADSTGLRVFAPVP